MLNFRLTIGTVVDKRFGTLGACLAHLMRNEGEQLNICGTAFIYRQDEDTERCIVVFDIHEGMGNPAKEGVASATS